MNTRSSISRQHNAKRAINATATTPFNTSCQQQRLAGTSRRLEGSNARKQLVAELSQAERDALLRQQALSETQQGNHEQAIALFSLLIQHNPHSATDYNNRGLVYFKNGQLEDAIADYNQALHLNPRLDSAYNNRANYYAAQGQLLEAIEDYDMAIDLNPGNVRAWINQGITYRDLQQYEQAIQCFEFALFFGRLEGHIYAERGRTHHLNGDWNCAIADYKRAVEHLPDVMVSATNPSSRLRLQVEVWLDDLLSPLEV